MSFFSPAATGVRPVALPQEKIKTRSWCYKFISTSLSSPRLFLLVLLTVFNTVQCRIPWIIIFEYNSLHLLQKQTLISSLCCWECIYLGRFCRINWYLWHASPLNIPQNHEQSLASMIPFYATFVLLMEKWNVSWLGWHTGATNAWETGTVDSLWVHLSLPLKGGWSGKLE